MHRLISRLVVVPAALTVLCSVAVPASATAKPGKYEGKTSQKGGRVDIKVANHSVTKFRFKFTGICKPAAGRGTGTEDFPDIHVIPTKKAFPIQHGHFSWHKQDYSTFDSKHTDFSVKGHFTSSTEVTGKVKTSFTFKNDVAPGAAGAKCHTGWVTYTADLE